MKFEFSNKVLRVKADDEFITLSVNGEQFELKIAVEDIKKAMIFLLNSVEKSCKIDSKN